MLSRDLVPIAQGCPLEAGIGKPLRIAVDNCVGARGCGRSLVPANVGATHVAAGSNGRMGGAGLPALTRQFQFKPGFFLGFCF
jgi:hypothetical protein